MEFAITTENSDQTKNAGQILAGCLKSGAVIGLIGELGSGKTELVKGIAKGLGIDESTVSSPTYTLINEYDGDIPLYHFDLYRLERLDQLDDIGAEEYFWGDGICAVEWADLFLEALPKEILIARYQVLGKNLRKIKFIAQSTDYIDEKKLKMDLQK